MAALTRDTRALQEPRIHWLDNLRTCMILLVVLVHAGGVYESSGIWGFFWIVDDPSTNNISGILFLILDIFVMPTLFFVSGFLTPSSVENRSSWEFIKSKLNRLIIPWIVAVLTLIPLYKAVFLYSRNLPQESWATYFHWSNGIWSQNWLWFLPVLFLFNAVYLLSSRAKICIPNMSLQTAVSGAFVAGFVYSVSMDLFGLRGWTQNALLDFQNERILIYFMVFLLGALCFRFKAFEATPNRIGLYITMSTIAWIPVTIYVVFLLHPFFHPGQVLISQTTDTIILWFSYQCSLMCLMYITIETFRRYQDTQGRLRNELNRNSYYVYIIHVIVMGCLALVMLNTAIPSLAKHLLLTISTFVASNLVVSLFRVAVMPCRRTFRFLEPYSREVADAA